MVAKSKKTTAIAVPCTSEEKRKFQKVAATQYMNLAAYIRKLLHEAADAVDKAQTV